MLRTQRNRAYTGRSQFAAVVTLLVSGCVAITGCGVTPGAVASGTAPSANAAGIGSGAGTSSGSGAGTSSGSGAGTSSGSGAGTSSGSGAGTGSGASTGTGSGAGTGSGSGSTVTNHLPAWAATGFAGTASAEILPTLHIFRTSDYGASGSGATGSCSGLAGSPQLTCTLQINDFKPGQWIRLQAAGAVPATFAVTQSPVVIPAGNGTVGSHTFCYVVSSVDPLDGITEPSPQTCVANEPDLVFGSAFNYLTTTDHGAVQDDGPTPAFLWYASKDGGPFQLVTVTNQTSAAVDNGQRPTSRGGWPTELPPGNPDISRNENFFAVIAHVEGGQITLQDPLPSSITNTLLAHDDTDAVQNTILAAVAAGGGTVQLDKGSYNLFRPEFHGSNGSHSRQMNYFWWEGFSYLYIPDNALGHINLQGVSSQTVVNTPPDHGGAVTLLDFGQAIPPYIPYSPISIHEVEKGATTVQLADGAPSSSPQVGDDIELFSGSFGYGPSSCQDGGGEPAGCHFSELNTVAARNGNTITLVYPTSKRYYNDGMSSFGITVRTHLPFVAVPHILAIQHMVINTYNAIYLTGNVIGFLANDIQITGFVSHGPFAGGAKRDVTIENSSWGAGAGDATWNGTNEMDKYTNVLFSHNIVSGYAAATAEGLSIEARIYATEGSSQFTFLDNTFTNLLLLFQSTTDDAIVHNTFSNGEVNVGYGYDNNSYNFTAYHNYSYLSFNSQENALIDNNTFTEDASYQVPVVISLGDFTNGTISNNVISDFNDRDIPAIISYGGMVTGNSVSFTSKTQYSVGIALLPDPSPVGPGAPIAAQLNTVHGTHVGAGILLVDPGFAASTPVCVEGNIADISSGPALANYAPSNFNLTCNGFNPHNAP